MQDKSKLYIVVRNDLSPGSQLAQSCHAVLQFREEHPDVTLDWMKISNHICILQVENLDKLNVIINKASSKRVKFSCFIEPDLNDEITCIVLEPGKISKKICANMKLALK